MDAPSAIVLVIVAVLLSLAVSSMVRKHRRGGCAGCGDTSCSMHGSPRPAGADQGASAACPSVQRAMRRMDAKLAAGEGGVGEAGRHCHEADGRCGCGADGSRDRVAGDSKGASGEGC